MAFIIAKMPDGVAPLYISCWAITDFTKSDWNLDFVMSAFDSKIFKGMKKDELQNIVAHMRLEGTKMNVKRKEVDKTIAEMKDTIEQGWDKYFGGITTTTTTTTTTTAPKMKGMHNSGQMMECYECGIGWSNTQGYECSICLRSWTRLGLTPPRVTKDDNPDTTVDLIDLLDYNDRPAADVERHNTYDTDDNKDDKKDETGETDDKEYETGETDDKGITFEIEMKRECLKCGTVNNVSQCWLPSQGVTLLCDECFAKDPLPEDGICESGGKIVEVKSDEEENEVEHHESQQSSKVNYNDNKGFINIVWIGSRSKQKQTYEIKPSMTIGEFKKMIFMNNHGTQFCPISYEFEEDWTECHNIVLIKSGMIMEKVKRTFADYGLTDDEGVPFELSFKLVMKGGMGKRGRITGEVKLTPAIAAKIAALPQVLTLLSAAKFDEDDLKALIRNMNDDQLAETITMWEHSK
jgi:hypothetical protein